MGDTGPGKKELSQSPFTFCGHLVLWLTGVGCRQVIVFSLQFCYLHCGGDPPQLAGAKSKGIPECVWRDTSVNISRAASFHVILI